MDDATALRLEQVKLAFLTAERLIDLRARRHLAVLAVVLAGALSAVAAGLGAQLPALLVAALVALLSVVALVHLWALERLGIELREAGAQANADLERLMRQEGEQGADASEVHAS